MEGGGSDATPRELMEGGSSVAAPHEPTEGGGSVAAPHEPMEGSGPVAAPSETRETSPPASEQEGQARNGPAHMSWSRGPGVRPQNVPAAQKRQSMSPIPLVFSLFIFLFRPYAFFPFADSCDGATLWGQRLRRALPFRRDGWCCPTSPLFRAGAMLSLRPRWPVRRRPWWRPRPWWLLNRQPRPRQARSS